MSYETDIGRLPPGEEDYSIPGDIPPGGPRPTGTSPQTYSPDIETLPPPQSPNDLPLPVPPTTTTTGLPDCSQVANPAPVDVSKSGGIVPEDGSDYRNFPPPPETQTSTSNLPQQEPTLDLPPPPPQNSGGIFDQGNPYGFMRPVSFRGKGGIIQ